MKKGRFDVTEIDNTEVELWKLNQRNNFQATIDLLSRGKSLAKGDMLLKLNPFVDVHGIFLVGGRLLQADLPYSVNHPIILHANSHAVRLLISHVHRKCGHLGKEAMGVEIKQQFCIIKLKNAMQQIINECKTCKRIQGKPSSQLMANLPPDRIIGHVPPFTNTATDIFGPFYASRGRGKHQEKRYGVLFSCLVSRATHIEITPGLDTDSYINAAS